MNDNIFYAVTSKTSVDPTIYYHDDASSNFINETSNEYYPLHIGVASLLY